MASKGLRVIAYHGTQKVEAGYNPSQTTETLLAIPRVSNRKLFILSHLIHLSMQKYYYYYGLYLQKS
jgi:hypothetical protein